MSAKRLRVFLLAHMLVSLTLFSAATGSVAQSEQINLPDDQALLVEGDPGFKKPVKVEEEEKIEKPKIYENVQNYFSSMSNLLVIAGVILLLVAIVASTRKDKDSRSRGP